MEQQRTSLAAAAAAGAVLGAICSSRKAPAQSSQVDSVSVQVGANTRYILSTSGRPSSLERYRRLLQEVICVDVAYIPISAEGPPGSPIDPERFCWALRGLNCVGGAISRDIKARVLPFLDDVDEFAQRVGSVNTVLRRGDRLVGYNTDADGFRKAIVTGVSASGASVRSAVVYGYGGVTNVVVHVLKELGYAVALTGRRLDEASRRADELGATLFKPGDSAEFQLLVNAAPVTDKPLGQAKGLLEALACVQQGAGCVFDHEMPGAELERYCAAHSLYHINGKSMYYPQMYRQVSQVLPASLLRYAFPNSNLLVVSSPGPTALCFARVTVLAVHCR
jgi:shikimate 5-dehydrogenase